MLFEKIQLEGDEEILSTLRAHWFILFAQGLSVLFLAFLPLVGWYIVLMADSSGFSTLSVSLSSYTGYFFMFYSIWLLLQVMAFAYMWTNYRLDVWIITSKRIIAIDQVRLFDREIGSFRLERLQDVNIEISGIIATFLDYGLVEAQTASGSADEFIFRNLPNPREVKATILAAADKRISNGNADGVS